MVRQPRTTWLHAPCPTGAAAWPATRRAAMTGYARRPLPGLPVASQPSLRAASRAGPLRRWPLHQVFIAKVHVCWRRPGVLAHTGAVPTLMSRARSRCAVRRRRTPLLDRTGSSSNFSAICWTTSRPRCDGARTRAAPRTGRARCSVLPKQAGDRGQPRIIPYLPGKKLLVTEAVLQERVLLLDEYVKVASAAGARVCRSAARCAWRARPDARRRARRSCPICHTTSRRRRASATSCSSVACLMALHLREVRL